MSMGCVLLLVFTTKDVAVNRPSFLCVLLYSSPQVNLWLELVPHLHSLNEVTQLIPTTTKVRDELSVMSHHPQR